MPTNYRSMIETPVLFYDNYCKICYNLAKIISIFSRGRVAIIGMYSRESSWIREIIDPTIYHYMPWLYSPKKKCVYGGRALILPLLKEMIIGMIRGGKERFRDPPPDKCSATLPCEGFIGLVYRLAHIAFKSKTIKLSS
ncbi:MAG: hypothetical protein ABWJ42_00190 [Sulfolobales archaeon]